MTQSMAASDSRPPSRLVLITVGASNPKAVKKVPGDRSSRTERIGQQVVKPARPGRMVDQQLGSAVLQQHLTAPPARHQHRAPRVDARQRHQPAATGRMQGAHHPALGTETKAI